MATPNPYFLYPFGSSGDTTAIVDTTGTNAGVVNYQYGFTPNYELNLAGGGAALPVPRPPFNQLMLDVTTAIQNLQKYGVSPWVSEADGGPASPDYYPLYARVGYTPSAGAYAGLYQIWESQVAANDSTPGDNNDWLPVSGASMVQVGTIQWFAGANGLPGSLKCNGANVLRSDYPALFNALTVQQTAISNSTTTLTVTSTANLSVGAGALIEGTGITPGTYIVSILSSTTIQMSAASTASGTSTMIFFIWGNTGNASTTFNLPNLYRQVAVGASNLGAYNASTLGDYLGQSGGEDSHTILLAEMAPHTHNASSNSNDRFLQSRTGTTVSNAIPQNISGNQILTPSVTGDMTGFSSQTPLSLIQKSTNLWAYIKY